jgi:hypothetical protein
MRFYNQPHTSYAGGNLHARTVSLCVLDASGRTCLQKTIPALAPSWDRASEELGPLNASGALRF